MDSSKFAVIISDDAKKDIVDVLNYISENLFNPTAANKLWEEMKDAVNRASMFPYAMQEFKDEKITQGKSYRRLDVNNYVLIYRIKEEQKEIYVLAVFYAPSNLAARILNRIN